MEQPLVSVITITRNRGNLIGRCVQSVLEQTYHNIEYIVVDGASTDSTDEVIASFKDERLIYIKLNENLAIKTTIDIGIQRAQGKYITFLDSDDEYVPEKIAKQVALIETLPMDYGFVYCWMTYYDDKTHQVDHVHAPQLRGMVAEEVISEPIVSGTPTLMFRAEVLRDLDGWKSTEELGIVADWELCARACQKYKVDYLPESLVNVYVNHGFVRQSEKRYYNAVYQRYIKFHTYFLTTYKTTFAQKPFLAFPHYRALCSLHFRLNLYSKSAKYFRKAFMSAPSKTMTWLLFSRFKKYGNKVYKKILSLVGRNYERIICLIANIKSSSYRGKIMMYHEILLEDLPRESCKCTVSHFLSDLNDLSNAGFELVSIEEALRIIKNKEKRKFAVLTFDDVSSSFYNVYSILCERNIPYTLFVAMKYTKQKGFLSIQQLKELSQDPLCTIGAHTLTHPILRSCKKSAEEIIGGKMELEKIMQCDIKFFAYPYGKPNMITFHNLKEVKTAGYECAFGTIDADITPLTKSLYYFPRLTSVWK